MQGSLYALKRRLNRSFSVIVASLTAALILLFYLTSLLSKATTLSDTFVDILIYTIYLSLVLVLGSMTFVLYNYFDEETLLEPVLPIEMESLLIPNRVIPEKKALFSEHAAQEPVADIQSLLNEAKEKLPKTLPSLLKGFKELSSLALPKMFDYLSEQHPQVVSVILVTIDSDLAHRLLTLFRVELREVLLANIEGNDRIDVSLLMLLDEALLRDLWTTQKECLSLMELSDSEVRELLRHISKLELMFALKATSQELQEMFFVNMSAKASTEFKTVLHAKVDVDASKCDNALKNLYLLAQQLREDGKIRAI